jgi:hypothetical protein
MKYTVKFTILDKDGNEYDRNDTIGFIPFVGHWIDCGDGDYREVRFVYIKTEYPDQLTVDLVDDERFTQPTMLAHGWSLVN